MTLSLDIGRELEHLPLDEQVRAIELMQFYMEPIAAPRGWVLEQDVSYSQIDPRLFLHIYHPESDGGEAHPAVVFVHGGGWSSGGLMLNIKNCGFLAQRGYVAATVRYRLSGEAPFPASLEDVKCAVRWLRANADRLGADPDRIAIAGTSAGGHLAAMVSLTPGEFEGAGGYLWVPSEVMAAVLWYPVTDLHKESCPGLEERIKEFLGPEQANRPELVEDASPITHVSPDAPPTLIFTGDADEFCPLPMIESYHHSLETNGVPSTLRVFPGGIHGFDIYDTSIFFQCLDEAAGFLDRVLGGPGSEEVRGSVLAGGA